MNIFLSAEEEQSTVIDGSNPEGTTTSETTTTTETTDSSGGLFGEPGMSFLGFYILIFLALYVFLMRPQKKKNQKIKEMQQMLKVGDKVITTSGMYGKIASIDDRKIYVEFGQNKTVIIPIRKSEVFVDNSDKIQTQPEPTPKKKKGEVKKIEETTNKTETKSEVIETTATELPKEETTDAK